MAESVGLRWYSTGTISTTANSTTVNGSSTNFVTAGIKPGDIFTVDRSTFYEIAAVNSNTKITLAQAFADGAKTNVNYYIIRNFAATLQSELAAQIAQQNAIYQTWMDGRVTEIGIEYQYYKQYKNAWTSGTAYKALDIVMYNSALYVCTQAHNSSSSITPANTLYWSSYAPAMPQGLDIFNYNNAGAHNAIYRGKSLGSSLTGAQSAAVQAGTFDDIYPGDYWTFSNVAYSYTDENGDTQSGTYSGTMRVMDLDYFMSCGDTRLTTHHVVVVPDVSMFTAAMNDTNTTEGGYAGSKMRTVHLKRAEAIFKACFGSSHILSHREYLVNAVADGIPSGSAWFDSLVELMDERMVYGSCMYDSIKSNGTNVPDRISTAISQLNAFRHNKELIVNKQYFWLRNVVSTVWFARIHYSGICNCGNAANAYGVRPYALIY